jgi:hypothetical protein
MPLFQYNLTIKNMEKYIPTVEQRKILVNRINEAISRMTENVNAAIFSESASGNDRFDAPPNGARFSSFDKNMILASPTTHLDGLCLPVRN